MIPQLKSIFNKNQWVQIQNWVNGRLTLKQDKFNESNTATGGSSVTINATSGIATFTSIVSQDTAPTPFTINNSLVTTSSVIRAGLSYSPQGDEICGIASVVAGSGVIYIYLTNYSTIDAAEDKIINFQIIN